MRFVRLKAFAFGKFIQHRLIGKVHRKVIYPIFFIFCTKFQKHIVLLTSTDFFLYFLDSKRLVWVVQVDKNFKNLFNKSGLFWSDSFLNQFILSHSVKRKSTQKWDHIEPFEKSELLWFSEFQRWFSTKEIGDDFGFDLIYEQSTLFGFDHPTGTSK